MRVSFIYRFLFVFGLLFLGAEAYANTDTDQKSKMQKKSALKKTLTDTIAVDSVQIDSLTGDTIKTKKFVPDTVTVSGGILPIVREYALDRKHMMDSIAQSKKKQERAAPSELAMLRSPIFKDTISFSNVAALSFIAPGFGQLYNKQYWKIPVLYGTVGGFAGLSIMASKNIKRSDAAFRSALANGLPQAEIDRLKIETNRYRTQKTLFVAGAVASYIYFVGDAAINYRGKVQPTNRATVLSAILPGAGQVYNGSYWKLPIVYGGIATIGYVIDYNNRGYQRFKIAYNAFTDNDPNTVDEFNGKYSAEVLQNTRNSYRRYRDLGVVYMLGFYLLNIIDAHVDAYLRRYDISDNLSMRVEPSLGERVYLASKGNINLVGVSMKLQF